MRIFEYRPIICYKTAILVTLLLFPLQGYGSDDGIGFVVGTPTGLTYKAWTNKREAYDYGAGWRFGNNTKLSLKVDKLIHIYDELKVDVGQLPYYMGFGVFLESDENAIGIRVPFGLNYLFEKEPFDIFVEIVPQMSLLPETDLVVNSALGARYHFR